LHTCHRRLNQGMLKMEAFAENLLLGRHDF
jgi:hypothetical protein